MILQLDVFLSMIFWNNFGVNMQEKEINNLDIMHARGFL
jgi:hypothetical protein